MKQPPRGASLRQVFLLVTLVFLTYLGLATVSRVAQAHALKQEAEQLKDEIAELKVKNQALVDERAHVQSDAYIEKVARQELNLIKPGETAVIVVAAPPHPRPESTPPPPSKGPRPNWQLWWNLFWGSQ